MGKTISYLILFWGCFYIFSAQLTDTSDTSGEALPPPAAVQPPTAPPAAAQASTPPPAAATDPTPPPAAATDPTPPPVAVQTSTPPPAAVQTPTPPPAAATATPEINLTSTVGFVTSTPAPVAANMTASVSPVPFIGRITAVKDASQQELNHLAVLQVVLTSHEEVRDETINELMKLFFEELNLDATTHMATITKFEKVRADP